MEKWEHYRQRFPHVAERIYLNHAALGPMHEGSLAAVEACNRERASANIEYWPDALEQKQRFKGLVGRLINGAPERIAVTENTSMALNWLAQGLTWTPGDRVLLNNFEFPSNVVPFLNLQRQGVEIDFVPHRRGRIHLDDIAAAIRPETRLLSISYVEFLNGFRNDLAAIGELCRAHDVIFCVDGIQGLGALQLDVEELGIDFLACGGQKWLMWPLGTAFMYFSETLFEKVTPMAPGWLSVENSWDFFDYSLDFLPTAERFEPGMYNVAGVVGACASLEMMLDVGPSVIERRVTDTATYLVEHLLAHDYDLFTPVAPAERAGIVTFAHPRAEELADALLRRFIHVSLRDGMIRVSPHFYNTTSDIDKLMDAVLSFDNRRARRAWEKRHSESYSPV